MDFKWRQQKDAESDGESEGIGDDRTTREAIGFFHRFSAVQPFVAICFVYGGEMDGIVDADANSDAEERCGEQVQRDTRHAEERKEEDCGDEDRYHGDEARQQASKACKE